MKGSWSVGLALTALVLLATSCTINRDIMFKTPVDYAFDTVPDSTSPTFRIQPNDNLQFRLFANKGFKMIDFVSDDGANSRLIQRMTFTYVVEYDGSVKLPILGYVPLAGLTLREAELRLEELYTPSYKDPFVQLQVSNRRVVVFTGGGGTAKVIPIENNNPTLLEVIGLAGGLDNRGNAHKVKVFRRKNDGKGRFVYQFDLSDIDGLPSADMIMQGDDVVYVQPNADIAREVLQDLTPVISLLTSVVLVIGIVNGLSR